MAAVWKFYPENADVRFLRKLIHIYQATPHSILEIYKIDNHLQEILKSQMEMSSVTGGSSFDSRQGQLLSSPQRPDQISLLYSLLSNVYQENGPRE
jgi:hypothetical protein